MNVQFGTFFHQKVSLKKNKLHKKINIYIKRHTWNLIQIGTIQL